MKPYSTISTVPKIHPAYENARGSESMPIPSNSAVLLKSLANECQLSLKEAKPWNGLTVWLNVLCPVTAVADFAETEIEFGDCGIGPVGSGAASASGTLSRAS